MCDSVDLHVVGHWGTVLKELGLYAESFIDLSVVAMSSALREGLEFTLFNAVWQLTHTLSSLPVAHPPLSSSQGKGPPYAAAYGR